MLWTPGSDFGIIRRSRKKGFGGMALSSQFVGLAIGWLAVGWVAVQALVVVVRTTQRRIRWQREHVRDRAEFCRRVEAAARIARATQAIPDWSGWRPFRVAAIVDEARDVKSFYLTPVDGKPLSPFLPGQYLTFRLPVVRGDAPLVRCYSLSDRPRQDYYRVTVKRIAAPPGRAGLSAGRASSFLHDKLQVGDLLDVRAPAGTFLVEPSATEPLALIGAGIGVTPLVSMLEAILHAGRQRAVFALLGFRSGAEHPFKARLERLRADHPEFQLHVCYSAPGNDDVIYKDYHHHGRLSIDRIRQVLPSNNMRFFVCGPGGLMEHLVPALWGWGVPESHVHFEAFGPASVQGATRAKRPPSQACEVRFVRSGRSATWDDSFASLLEFGESAGVTLPSGCRAGSCGQCATAIHSGNVRLLKQPGFPVPADHCLTCVSVPAGALALEA
jgi:ferredoxin-NADP reductase